MKVVKRSQIPSSLPISGTLTMWLFLDRLHAPGWIWGVLGTVYAVGWIASITMLYLEDEADVFPAAKP